MTEDQEGCNPLSYYGQDTCTAGRVISLCPFVQFFYSLEFALQVHVTFNVALNLITISFKHLKVFPQKCLLVKGHFLNQCAQDFSGRQGCTHQWEWAILIGCEESDSHSRGKAPRGMPLLTTPRQLSVASPIPDVLRNHDLCEGFVGKGYCLISWPRFFQTFRWESVSQGHSWSSFTDWGVPKATKGQFMQSATFTPVSAFSFSQSPPPLSTEGFFPFFAKQPCERDKIILKSIIWWEFWQWVEDGNYSSIRLSGFGQISCIETGDQGMGSWIVFHCCHGDSDAGGL